MKVDGTGYAGITNFVPSEFSAVKMFAGDPWYMHAKGNIRNLEVQTETVDLQSKLSFVFSKFSILYFRKFPKDTYCI